MARKAKRTLGQLLDDARTDAELSVRQLADAADVPKSVVGRLLRDEIEQPVPDHLARLADVLELRLSEVLLLAGLPVPAEALSVEALLRTEYDLPDSAIREAKAQIEAIAARYRRDRATN